MRIRSWIITGSAALFVSGGLWLIVTNNEPLTATQVVRVAVWIAVALGSWALWATVLLWFRLHLAQAVWAAFVIAAGSIGILMLLQTGYRDTRVMTGVGVLTLALASWFAYALRPRSV